MASFFRKLFHRHEHNVIESAVEGEQYEAVIFASRRSREENEREGGSRDAIDLAPPPQKKKIEPAGTANNPGGDCSNGCKAESRCRLAAGASADPGSAAAAAAKSTQRRLLAAFVLCVAFVAAEFAGGALANSLAVMSDAAHMLSDAAGLATALVAARVGAAAAGASGGFSFGYARVEVLGALVSTVLTYIVTAVLVVEAVGRFKTPDDVDGKVRIMHSPLRSSLSLFSLTRQRRRRRRRRSLRSILLPRR